MFGLLLLLFIVLIPLLKSLDKSKTTFFSQKAGTLYFDSYKELFLLSILLLIFLSIMSFTLSL